MDPIETVRRIYAAFAAGDVPGVLAYLADDVEWEYGGTREIPWLEPLRGRAEVPRFFEALGALEMRRFEVKSLLVTGDIVVALIDLDAVVRATGSAVQEVDEAHIWHFHDGKVVRFRHRVDTLRHQHALHGPRLVAPTLA